MNFKISKRQICDGDGESDLYMISSDAPKGKHRLFFDWDYRDTRAIKALEALQIGGILIETPRGYHFIANVKPMDLKDMIAIQTLFGADAKWVSENQHTRKGAYLRVSQKYDHEEPLRVSKDYLYTDEELKRKYEDIVDEYFYKGDPYYIDSDSI